MELFERIRRDARDEGLSIRTLAVRHHVHRRLVRQALADASPPPRRRARRAAPALGPHVATVRRWLTEDLEAPRKQRHTARRVWQRLCVEEGASVAESTVRVLVAELRRELAGGAGRVSVPQRHGPAEEAEVDFGEFYAWVAGTWTRLWMFVLRLSHSGRAVHVAYGNQAQESFFDGHVQAFARLGGVPTRIRYDNLKPAVLRVLLGRARLEHPRFILLRSHYLFDSFYCRPGVEGAHEKGGVELEVGRFRRAHLSPVPAVADLAELNARLAAADDVDQDRRLTGRTETVGAAAAREQPLLGRLPVEPFDPATLLSVRVDLKARVCVRQAYYSVPARLAGRRLPVRLTARTVEVFDGARPVACHPRSLHKNTEQLVLDHYLEVLARRPGAMPGASALAAARAGGTFTDVHERYWAAARRRVGDAAGTRALIAVLLLHRGLPTHAVLAGMTAALAADRLDADLVAVEARRHHDRRPAAADKTATDNTAPGAAAGGQQGVIGVVCQQRPAPDLSVYDGLLGGPAEPAVPG